MMVSSAYEPILTMEQDDRVADSNDNDVTRGSDHTISTDFDEDEELQMLVAAYLRDMHYSSPRQSVTNIVYSVINGGLVALPFFASQSGIPLFIGQVTAVTMVSSYSSVMVISMANERRKRTLEDLAETAFGPSGFLWVSIFQIIFSLTLMCVSLLVWGDIMSNVFDEKRHAAVTDWLDQTSPVLSDLLCTRRGEVLVGAAIVLPMCLLKKSLASLRWTSYVNVFAMPAALLAVLATYLTLSDNKDGSSSSSSSNSEHLDLLSLSEPKHQWYAVLLGIVFIFSYNQKVFIIYSGLRRHSTKRWQMVVKRAGAIIAAMYICFGILGYISKVRTAEGYDNFNYFTGDTFKEPSRTVYDLASVIIAFCLLLTIPVDCLVATTSFRRFLTKYSRVHYPATASASSSAQRFHLIKDVEEGGRRGGGGREGASAAGTGATKATTRRARAHDGKEEDDEEEDDNDDLYDAGGDVNATERGLCGGCSGCWNAFRHGGNGNANGNGSSSSSADDDDEEEEEREEKGHSPRRRGVGYGHHAKRTTTCRSGDNAASSTVYNPKHHQQQHRINSSSSSSIPSSSKDQSCDTTVDTTTTSRLPPSTTSRPPHALSSSSSYNNNDSDSDLRLGRDMERQWGLVPAAATKKNCYGQQATTAGGGKAKRTSGNPKKRLAATGGAIVTGGATATTIPKHGTSLGNNASVKAGGEISTAAGTDNALRARTSTGGGSIGDGSSSSSIGTGTGRLLSCRSDGRMSAGDMSGWDFNMLAEQQEQQREEEEEEAEAAEAARRGGGGGKEATIAAGKGSSSNSGVGGKTSSVIGCSSNLVTTGTSRSVAATTTGGGRSFGEFVSSSTAQQQLIEKRLRLQQQEKEEQQQQLQRQQQQLQQEEQQGKPRRSSLATTESGYTEESEENEEYEEEYEEHEEEEDCETGDGDGGSSSRRHHQNSRSTSGTSTGTANIRAGVLNRIYADEEEDASHVLAAAVSRRDRDNNQPSAGEVRRSNNNNYYKSGGDGTAAAAAGCVATGLTDAEREAQHQHELSLSAQRMSSVARDNRDQQAYFSGDHSSSGAGVVRGRGGEGGGGGWVLGARDDEGRTGGSSGLCMAVIRAFMRCCCCPVTLTLPEVRSAFVMWLLCVSICLFVRHWLYLAATVGTVSTTMLVFVFPSMLYFRLGLASDFEAQPLFTTGLLFGNLDVLQQLNILPNRLYMGLTQLAGVFLLVLNIGTVVCLSITDGHVVENQS